MRVIPSQFEQRVAYLVGFQSPEHGTFPNMADELRSIKASLLNWGFKQNEIKMSESEAELPDLSNEYQSIAESATEGKKTLVVFFYKGHGTLKVASIHGNSELGDSKNLEGFVRKLASLPSIYVLSAFDCCKISP